MAGNENLYGLLAVRRFIGKTDTEARHLIDSGELPIFKIGAMICAFKPELRVWLDRQSANRSDQVAEERGAQ
jgi:hypothetical protein